MTTNHRNSHFLSSEIDDNGADNSFFHIIPVPLEKTVSYGGGTNLGPKTIIEASDQLELWDGKSKPAELGIHTQATIDCNQDCETILQQVAAANAAALKLGKFPITLGGEHTVTYGVIQGYIDAGISDFGVVQIDAHADLREAYEDDPLSHASVMKRVVDLGIPLVQLGIRAYCEEEMQTRKDFNVTHYDADELVPDNIREITLPEDFPKKVFFTLDIDGMDPSVFPSTGTPVPGGLNWYQTLGLFESVVKQRQCIGFDIMEYAPIENFHAYDFAAAQLTYKMMGIVQRHIK